MVFSGKEGEKKVEEQNKLKVEERMEENKMNERLHSVFCHAAIVCMEEYHRLDGEKRDIRALFGEGSKAGYGSRRALVLARASLRCYLQ